MLSLLYSVMSVWSADMEEAILLAQKQLMAIVILWLGALAASYPDL